MALFRTELEWKDVLLLTEGRKMAILEGDPAQPECHMPCGSRTASSVSALAHAKSEHVTIVAARSTWGWGAV